MSDDILVKDIMSKPVTISKSALITDALDRMLDEGIDPLIVVNHNTGCQIVLKKNKPRRI